MNNYGFEKLKFKYEFRKHQRMMLEKFQKLRKECKSKTFKFQLVSPPGSGKTIVGLEMAVRIGKPALIICPNTAIQGQWADKLYMFSSENDKEELKKIVSTDANDIKLINVFTYQTLSVPLSDDDSFIRVSENLWADTICESQGASCEEALLRISTMKKTNYSAYRSELSKFNRKLRQRYLNDPRCSISKILHPNTVNLIEKLRENNVETIVFDECHHLQSYWALTMREIVRETGVSNIIGLTATPPLDEDKEKLECYMALLGGIDYQIPTPAVVKEGMLAPYQDLVYFCTPLKKEIEYIRDCHSKFKSLIELFDSKDGHFYFWIYDRIVKRKLLSGATQDWTAFINSRSSFGRAGVKYLMKNGCSLPWDITVTEEMYEELTLQDWICLIEDYSLNLLKISSNEEDIKLYDEIKAALRSLGYLLTEKGIRSHRSPIDRVLAYSKSKLEGVREILRTEMKSLGDKIRAAIITDFEVSNSISGKSIEDILDDECGGAISVMKELVTDPQTDLLDPVMITAKSLICDDDLAERFIELGMQWIKENMLQIQLTLEQTPFEKFHSVVGMGKDWNSKTAVLLTTHLFEEGVTKCVIGTRGLLSEGWDSLSLNTLIDLTAVTTFASVNQLRGRSIRKSRGEDSKVANNWDVICIAPGLEKGYNDLLRLRRKHDQYYGVCDDGQIQRGIDHVDPSIGIKEEVLKDDDINRINKSMLETVLDRERTYKLWRVGEPFDNVELGCCELRIEKPIKMKAGSVLVNERNILKGKIKGGIIKAAGTALSLTGACAALLYSAPVSIPLFGVSAFMGFKTFTGFQDLWGFGRENFFRLAVKSAVLDISKCVLYSLIECELIEDEIGEDRIVLTERSDGTLRVYLDGYDEASELFSNSLSQVFAPIEDQRYAVERYEVFVPESSFDKFIYLFRYGMDKCSPLLSCYHPLPEVFNIKNKALAFQKYWNKFVSPGEVIFLKSQKGREVVEKYGRTNFLGARKRNIKVWK